METVSQTLNDSSQNINAIKGKTVILHIGSSSCYLGISNEKVAREEMALGYFCEHANEFTSFHNIIENGCTDQLLPIREDTSDEADIYEALNEMVKTFKFSVTGSNVHKSDFGQSDFNKKVTSKIVNDENFAEKEQTMESVDRKKIFVGDEAVNMACLYPDKNEFRLIYPFKLINNFEQAENNNKIVLNSIFYIVKSLLENQFQIDLKLRRLSSVIFVLPDCFNRKLTSILPEYIFDHLEFGSLLLVQESVLASYLSRCSHCCVVNCGAEKTVISCVVNGVSLPLSRIFLNYGGSLINVCLYHRLNQINFPYNRYEPFDPYNDYNHFHFLEELKQKWCHLQEVTSGETDTASILTRKDAGRKRCHFTFKFGDELCMSSMSLFCANYLRIVSGHNLRKMATPFYYTEYNDESTDVYSNYTVQVLNKTTTVLNSENATNEDLNDHDESRTNDLYDDDKNLDQSLDNFDSVNATIMMKESSERKNSDKKSNNNNNTKKKYEMNFDSQDDSSTDNEADAREVFRPLQLQSNLLTIQEAIIKSVFSQENRETSEKLLENILIVGGGLGMEGVESLLKQRLEALLPKGKGLKYKVEVQRVVSSGGDSSLVVWRGAEMLSECDSFEEVLVTRDEYREGGFNVFKDKLLFSWR